MTGDQVGLETTRQVHLAPDDGVGHLLFAAEVAYRAVPAGDADADMERAVQSPVLPLFPQFTHPSLHLQRHANGGVGIFFAALGIRITKEDQDCVADVLVERAAVLEDDLGHLDQVLVFSRVSVAGELSESVTMAQV